MFVPKRDDLTGLIESILNNWKKSCYKIIVMNQQDSHFKSCSLKRKNKFSAGSFFIYDIKLSRYQPLTHTSSRSPKDFLEACCIFNFVCPFFIFTSNSACQKTSFIFRITKQAESYHPFGERLLQIYGSIPTHLFQAPRLSS
jgi:hypothetical protein